jgi:arsenate reductase
LVTKISEGKNPIFAIKFGKNNRPIIGFSKKHDSSFNPNSEFIAVMTCSSAANECPMVKGTKIRFALTYDDPKVSDHTPNKSETYTERSEQIATEMKYLMKLVKTNQKDLKN